MSTATLKVSRSREVVRLAFGKTLSYGVLILWTLLTVVPLALDGVLRVQVQRRDLARRLLAPPRPVRQTPMTTTSWWPRSSTIILDYDPDVDTRERLIIESTEIAPTRRLMVQFPGEGGPPTRDRQPPAWRARECVRAAGRHASEDLRGQRSGSIFRSAWVRGAAGQVRQQPHLLVRRHVPHRDPGAVHGFCPGARWGSRASRALSRALIDSGT